MSGSGIVCKHLQQTIDRTTSSASPVCDKAQPRRQVRVGRALGCYCLVLCVRSACSRQSQPRALVLLGVYGRDHLSQHTSGVTELPCKHVAASVPFFSRGAKTSNIKHPGRDVNGRTTKRKPGAGRAGRQRRGGFSVAGSVGAVLR